MCAYTGNYKYDPEAFSHMLCIADDLRYFYNALEAYNDEPHSNVRSLELRLKWEDLFFSIKHREVEGYLSPVDAYEMRCYLEDLVDDRL